MQISADCRWLLTASLDGTVRCWDIPGELGLLLNKGSWLLLEGRICGLPPLCFCCRAAVMCALALVTPAPLLLHTCLHALTMHTLARARMVVSFV